MTVVLLGSQRDTPASRSSVLQGNYLMNIGKTSGLGGENFDLLTDKTERIQLGHTLGKGQIDNSENAEASVEHLGAKQQRSL